MKLSISLFLAGAPAALAGTNKTLAPTPGVIRPTPFPTGFTPEPTYVLKTPAPTECEARDFYFDGFECTNAGFADGQTYSEFLQLITLGRCTCISCAHFNTDKHLVSSQPLSHKQTPSNNAAMPTSAQDHTSTAPATTPTSAVKNPP